MLTVLSRVDIFQGLPADGLERLARAGRPRTFGTGSALMRQGEPSESVHVILDGRVRVERSHPLLEGPLVLAELGPGELVGEMGLLDGELRSATVTALGDTRTLELGASALAESVLLYPQVSVALMRTLSRRLRSTYDLVGLMREEQR